MLKIIWFEKKHRNIAKVSLNDNFAGSFSFPYSSQQFFNQLTKIATFFSHKNFLLKFFSFSTKFYFFSIVFFKQIERNFYLHQVIRKHSSSGGYFFVIDEENLDPNLFYFSSTISGLQKNVNLGNNFQIKGNIN